MQMVFTSSQCVFFINSQSHNSHGACGEIDRKKLMFSYSSESVTNSNMKKITLIADVLISVKKLLFSTSQ